MQPSAQKIIDMLRTFDPGHRFRFYVDYDRASLDFAISAEDMIQILSDLSGKMNVNDPAIRTELREHIRIGLIDNRHVTDQAEGQRLGFTVATYMMTGSTAPVGLAQRADGFILEITRKHGKEHNFRTMICDGAAVDAYRDERRKGAKTIVDFTKPQPKPEPDPSVEPPPRPRPDMWLKPLAEVEQVFGKDRYMAVRTCLEDAPMFVFKSRQIEEPDGEEVMESFKAMIAFKRFALPHPFLYAETSEFVTFVEADTMTKTQVRVGIAAWQEDPEDEIRFGGFIERNGKRLMSPLIGTIDTGLLSDGYKFFQMDTHNLANPSKIDESTCRLILHAAGDALLQLILLLSTKGTEQNRIDPVERINASKLSVKEKQRKLADRHMTRPYTVIRVPFYSPSEGSGEGAKTGRWVRPHLRRAHVWGINTRPAEEQRWVPATLVNAAKVENEDVQRPIYVV